MGKIANSTEVYVNEKQVSEITAIGIQTLRNWRQLGRGFPYCKVGRSVRYSLADVRAYMESRKVMTEGT